MIFDPKIFYLTYLEDFHKYKSLLYNKILSDLPKYEKEIFGEELEEDDKNSFRRSIKSDLRQTYFHAIESFFEVFFALCPNEKVDFDDENILFNLTNSNWKANYDKIVKIASGDLALDFLDSEIEYEGYKISIGHYLFYFGLFKQSQSDSEFIAKMKLSIEAIKFGIKIIATDFVDREEYNSYKHGLRIIPATSELMFADAETMEIKVRFDLQDSMSFYSKTKDPNEIITKTKLFDTNRDFEMTNFCSNMISNIVHCRQIFFYRERTMKKGKDIAVAMFGKKEIEECCKMNVQVQDLVYKIKRVIKKDK